MRSFTSHNGIAKWIRVLLTTHVIKKNRFVKMLRHVFAFNVDVSRIQHKIYLEILWKHALQ
jgi:hypothetical protein